MGTNFYLRKKITEVQLKAAHEALDKYAKMIIDDVDFNKVISGLHERIHIGKRSCGWQFLWDYHGGKYYTENLEDITRWLKEYTATDWVLEDEYRREFTVEQFFQEELDGFLYTGYTLQTYDEAHPDEHHYYIPSDYEFIADGLRFSKSEDFA